MAWWLMGGGQGLGHDASRWPSLVGTLGSQERTTRQTRQQNDCFWPVAGRFGLWCISWEHRLSGLRRALRISPRWGVD